MPIGLCSLDVELRYLHINDWLASINGIPANEHIGRTVAEVAPQIEPELRRVIETGEPLIQGAIEGETPAQPGVVRVFRHSFLPVRSDCGEITGVTCLVEDLSEVQRSEMQFRELFESASDAMIAADAQGTIELANRQAAEVFGYTLDELLGQPIELLIPQRFREEHVKHRNSYVQTPARRPMAASSVLFGRRKDGSEFPVEVSLSPLNTDESMRILAVIVEVTEREAATLTLRDSDKIFRQLTENISAVFWMMDRDLTKVLYVSPIIEEVWGLSAEHVYSSPESWTDAIIEEDRENVFALFCQSSLKPARSTLNTGFAILTGVCVGFMTARFLSGTIEVR